MPRQVLDLAACRGRRREKQFVVVAGAQRMAQRPPQVRLIPAMARTAAAASQSSRAPTPLAPQSFARSPARPSDMSMQALAMPRSAWPRPTRGSGSRKRRSNSSRAAPPAASLPCRMASPAPASPGVPLTQSSSPAVAPLRRQRLPGGHPAADRDRGSERSARGVAADQRDTETARQLVEIRPRNLRARIRRPPAASGRAVPRRARLPLQRDRSD